MKNLPILLTSTFYIYEMKTEEESTYKERRDVLYYGYFLTIILLIPVTIRLNERDDKQMIARLNRFNSIR